MKVDGTSIFPVGSVQATGKTEQIKSKPINSGNDQVTVSDKVQGYQNLVQKAKEIPSVSEEKVKEITGLLAEGLYKPDTRKIAETLLNNPENKKV
ncbi:MAG TPA: flagellar biosynthesis anti-sigma factor FlgM [Desulfitobacteriaceae bacterium]|nr:flagellar biosynthesis anti-sigma factor FlgM [Desulfitobacteriaceae bacterium]